MADFSNDFAPDFNIVIAEPAALTTDPINPGILQTAGEDVLYRSASGLEKALATVEGQRLIAIYAELIRDQWDPDKISLNNLPYLAWATGVNLWEADWDDTFRRWWVKNQWQLKAQRGSDLGLQRFINAVSSSKAAISLVRYTAPPQRAYALRPDSDASIAFTGSPRVGDNITIDGRIFTFVAVNAVRDQANIHMMVTATIKDAADALNNSVTPAIQRFTYAASGSRLLISKRDPTDTGTFTVTTNVPAATVALIGERQAYVARFPQLRLYPYVARTKLPWNCFVGGVQIKSPVPSPAPATLTLTGAAPFVINTGCPVKTPAARALAVMGAISSISLGAASGLRPNSTTLNLSTAVPTTLVAVFDPMTLFPGVINGGFYVAASTGNTLTQFNDISGLGNHLTQSVSANRFDTITAGYGGHVCYRSKLFGNHPAFFNLPAITTHTQSFSFWAVVRSRSNQPGGSRCFVSFGPNFTDCMFEFTAGSSANHNTPNLRLWGNGTQQNAAAIGADSSISILVVSSSASGITISYNDWPQYTGAALSAMTLTGGFAFKRQDGFDLNGDIYEFGLLDRPLTALEMSRLKSRFNYLYRQSTPALGRVCIIGDSLSEGQNCSTAMLSWTSIVDDAMAPLGYVQSSYAQSGSYIGHSAGAWGVGAGDTGTGAFNSGYAKNIALCFIGTNDLTSGTSGGDPATTVLTNLKIYTNAMKTAGFTIVVCTIPPRADASWLAGMETQRLAFNAAVRTEPTFDAVVDLAALSALANPSDGVNFDTDKLHFLDAGEQAVAAAVQSVLTVNVGGIDLREDGSFGLREDGSHELRE